jgi:hypothetical protein
MTAVNLELPADLVSAAKLDRGRMKPPTKVIALALFREGAVSLGRAAELCATPLAVFMDFAVLMVCLPSTMAWSKEDRRTVARLRT